MPYLQCKHHMMQQHDTQMHAESKNIIGFFILFLVAEKWLKKMRFFIFLLSVISTVFAHSGV